MKFALVATYLLLSMQFAVSADTSKVKSAVFSSISLATDYRFNGVSLNNRNPARQVSLHLWRSDNYFAGVWASDVDFRDGDTSLEVDIYAGRTFYRDAWTFKPEVMYTSFNDENVPGPTYDFWQAKFSVSRDIKRSKLGTMLQWTPEGSAGVGNVLHIRLYAAHKINNWTTISALLGRRSADQGSERMYFDAGITIKWKIWSFDIRYFDTNVDEKKNCFYTDWCDPSIVAKLSIVSW